MTVYLVGAGPGDPGLLTRRGEELLRAADVVVYDRLAPSALLELAPPGAELIDVGKAPGNAAMTQPEINALLVEHGTAGREVVRLKGGDPFVFGRGGEEAEACIAAGVAFEVVPGITSAIAAAAYAGIPVTHRRVSTSFTVVTGHEDPTKGGSDTDWDALARAGGTLVILMGAGRITEIAKALIAGGRAETTPVAAVRNGSRPEQRTTFDWLVFTSANGVDAFFDRGLLPSGLDSRALAPVRIAVIGPGTAAALARRGLRADLVPERFVAESLLDAFPPGSAFAPGPARVLLARAEVARDVLPDGLAARGYEVEVLAVYRTEPAPPDAGALAQVRAGEVDVITFTSSSTVDNFCDAVGTELPDPQPLVVSIGPVTSETARARGLRVDVEADPHTIDGLVEALVHELGQ
jgi:uroporphyrinogen III methyltransferase/synthase